MNYSGLGAPHGLKHVTTQKYAGVFEQLFLTRELPPWSNSELKRLIKTPKIHFLDSGLLAALRDLSPQRIAEDRGAFGAVLETFVLSEAQAFQLERTALCVFTLSRQRAERGRYHNRGSGSEDRWLEVKASASVGASDFSGLRKLAESAGKRLTVGLVLYNGDAVVPFGPKLFAAPISSLWS